MAWSNCGEALVGYVAVRNRWNEVPQMQSEQIQRPIAQFKIKSCTVQLVLIISYCSAFMIVPLSGHVQWAEEAEK